MTAAATTEFYMACKDGDLKKVKTLLAVLSPEELNQQYTEERSTGLHAAAYYGHRGIVDLLLKSGKIDQSIKNADCCTAYDEAQEEVKELFTQDDAPEWIDVYKNAYRISYENHEHIKRWLTKVPLDKLLEEISVYINTKVPFTKQTDRTIIKDHLDKAKTDVKELARAYSEQTPFYRALNRDLANLGSDFRFQTLQMLDDFDHRDDEAPKNLGHYIFASILINHVDFEPYYTYTGLVYRGMNISESELNEYKEDKVTITRSFLSTSKSTKTVMTFWGGLRLGPMPTSSDGDHEKKERRVIRLPVLCVYNIKNPLVAIDMEILSVFPAEKEVLIVPFTVFRVASVTKITGDDGHIESAQIVLDEGKAA